jgi:hypothetical protein
MKIELAAAARIVPLTALMLGACASQSAYEKLERSFRRRVPERSAESPKSRTCIRNGPGQNRSIAIVPSVRRRDL